MTSYRNGRDVQRNSSAIGKCGSRQIAAAIGQLEGALLTRDQRRRSKACAVVSSCVYDSTRCDGHIHIRGGGGCKVSAHVQHEVSFVTGIDADLSAIAACHESRICLYAALRGIQRGYQRL